MGKQIVRQLDLEDGVDTLARWIAHRIAELIDRAEKTDDQEAKEAARREATDLILRVWERRRSWPHGWPLEKVARIAFQLSSVEQPWSAPEPDESSRWFAASARLAGFHDREKDACCHVALADVDTQAEQAWLDDHGQELAEEERDVLAAMIEVHRETMDEAFRLDNLDAPGFSRRPKEARARLAIDALRRIASERTEFLDSLELPPIPVPETDD